jgi:enamine deaminase RidA (YjgF/YER057c/UK114 family)
MKTVATDGAPRAIGPYSQAVSDGGFLFLSGQIPLDPATGPTRGPAASGPASNASSTTSRRS